MPNLRIFILLVLAGLCFGASLEEPQSSGDNSQDSGPPAEPKPSAQAEESNKENSKSKEQEQKEEKKEEEVENKEEESSTKGQKKHLGHVLPDFIGNSTQKKNYVTALQSNCHNQNQMYKINEEKIHFKNCTYICTRLGYSEESEERRIPKGMTCDRDNMTCPENGDCPNPPLPSC
uniref:Putative secreted protein n=1 Tax=Ixodes ricinus TaxID=34613 RepID=V5GIG8_IXORI